MNDNMKISLTLVAFDKMSKVIRDAVNSSTENFNKMQEKIKNTSQALEGIGKSATILGGVLTSMNAINMKVAADFESGMSNVATLIDTNVESLTEMNKMVLDISKRTPVALNDLTSALYDIRSAGIDANNQFQVLEKSAQLGVAGLGSTSEAVDLVTSSLNAFGLQGEKADRVYDTIFKTVKFGKTTISGIAQGFGSVAGTISASNIELDDYLAAVSALTTTGQPAAQAHTQIKAAISGMTRETEDSRKVFNALGVKDFKELIQKSGGMVEAFKCVADEVDNNAGAILKLFKSTEAYNAVIGLTNRQYKSYQETLDAMRNQPSFLDEGYQKKLMTANAQMQRMKNFMQKISIEMGTSLTPMFAKGLNLAEKGLNILEKMPQGFKNFLSISITGLGILITTFGVACLAGSKLLGVYSGFISKAREFAPAIATGSVKLLKSMNMGAFSHSLQTAINMGNSGNKLGLNLPQHAISGLFTDIRMLDNKLRTGVVSAFKSLPSNIAKSTIAMKDWAITSIKAIPTNIMGGLNAIKTGFLGLPNAIKSAMVTFRAFSLTLLTSPLGWIALAIAGVAFVIFKYWKPITGFFKGVFQGLKEGLAPLMPVFNQLVVALNPVLTPIKALFNWFKKLFQPVEDVGGAAEKMGVKFGKAIANIVVKLASLITKAFECGAKIAEMLSAGLLSKLDWVKNAISNVTQKIRDFLPHSPAKTGPLKDLHKVKISETIAQTIKAKPIASAMDNSLKTAMTQRGSKKGGGYGGATTINYNPTTTISGGSPSAKEDFAQMLKHHKDEILSLVRKENERQMRLAY